MVDCSFETVIWLVVDRVVSIHSPTRRDLELALLWEPLDLEIRHVESGR